MTEELFQAEIIRQPLEAQTNAEAITKMGKIMQDAGFVEASYVQSVLTREKDFPTGLKLANVCVAIPHAMPEDNVKKSGIGAARLLHPVKFHSMEDPSQTVEAQILFLLALRDRNAHLEILKRLFLSFQKEDLLQGLLQSKDEGELLEALRKNLALAS